MAQCFTQVLFTSFFLMSQPKKRPDFSHGHCSRISSLQRKIKSLSYSHTVLNDFFKVLNAVLFQPVSNSSFHVYCKNLSETIPKYPYNFWNGRNFLFQNKPLFPDKLSDFGGKILKATSFQLAPFNYQNEDGSRGGWEYRVMSALAEKLNFKLSINPPPNGELWGENKNGTFTGKGNFRKEHFTHYFAERPCW